MTEELKILTTYFLANVQLLQLCEHVSFIRDSTLEDNLENLSTDLKRLYDQVNKLVLSVQNSKLSTQAVNEYIAILRSTNLQSLIHISSNIAPRTELMGVKFDETLGTLRAIATKVHVDEIKYLSEDNRTEVDKLVADDGRFDSLNLASGKQETEIQKVRKRDLLRGCVRNIVKR